MKERFDWTTNPREETQKQIAIALRIVEQYEEQGYRLTLRQLYYRFVAGGLIPNTERSYKNLGRILDLGRMLGVIDWDSIEDRTRSLGYTSHWDDPADIIESAAQSFRIDKWQGQATRVEVWVEKEALAGVVQRVADRWDVPWFGCRGYASQSAMYAAGKRMARYLADGCERVVVLHLGDHDPSGIDMTRDIQARLSKFSRSDEVSVDRIALNMDQIEAYNPPPNPAKLSDSRAPDYVQRFGRSSWELDALPPADLDALIEKHVQVHLDLELYQEEEQVEDAQRRYLGQVSSKWGAVVDILDGLDEEE